MHILDWKEQSSANEWDSDWKVSAFLRLLSLPRNSADDDNTDDDPTAE